MLTSIENVHREGLIHRDIKPSNFVLGKIGDDKNRLYLVNFGMAKEYIKLNPETVSPSGSKVEF